MQWDRFISRLLKLLLKVSLPLAKSVLIPLGSTSQRPSWSHGQKSQLYEQTTTTLIMPTEEMENIMEIVKSLEFCFISKKIYWNNRK